MIPDQIEWCLGYIQRTYGPGPEDEVYSQPRDVVRPEFLGWRP